MSNRDIELLISKYSPAAICLQETLLTPHQTQNFKYYSAYYKSGIHFNPLNYRPIALTSCICKSVERIVNERLVWYLEKNGVLAKQQCGYRSNRSTVDHSVRLETFIRYAFIHNQHLVAVFFDLQKAYDTTWKYGILQDLHSMGLRGNLHISLSLSLSLSPFSPYLYLYLYLSLYLSFSLYIYI